MFCGIDIGNSKIKVRFLGENEEITPQAVGSVEDALSLCRDFKPENVAFCTTRRLSIEEKIAIEKEGWWFFHSQRPIPISVIYDTPETLGADRIAAVIGAATLFKDVPLLVADLGTALTLEILDREGRYVGGNISPGIQMRFDAMHEYTSMLPLTNLDSSEDCHFGHNTLTALQSGVKWGIINEIYGAFRLAQRDHGCKMTVLTGGGALLIYEELKEELKDLGEVIYVESLVTLGLETAYNYNHDKNN